jgi:hypothetical protein
MRLLELPCCAFRSDNEHRDGARALGCVRQDPAPSADSIGGAPIGSCAFVRGAVGVLHRVGVDESLESNDHARCVTMIVSVDS